MKNAHICDDCAAYLPTSRWRKSDSDHVMKKNNNISAYHLPFYPAQA